MSELVASSQLALKNDQLQLRGEVSFDTAALINQALEAQLQQGVKQLDCSGVSYADSALVALVIEARKLAKARGLDLQISGLPAATAKLAALYGVEALLSQPHN